MKRLEKQIQELQKRIADLKRQQREADSSKKAEKRVAGKPGRPRVDEDKLIRAAQLAVTHSLPDAAMRAGVGLTTLYKYGVKRKVLNAKTA